MITDINELDVRGRVEVDEGPGVSADTDGPFPHNKFSEDSRRRMSQAALGHAVSEETRKRISVAQIGKVVSEETRKKLSEAVLYRA